MKPNTSMVQYSRSGGSSTRRWITASSRTYAVKAPGSVKIGSRGASWVSSGGESKGFQDLTEAAQRAMRPNRRLGHAAQAKDRRRGRNRQVLAILHRPDSYPDDQIAIGRHFQL